MTKLERPDERKRNASMEQVASIKNSLLKTAETTVGGVLRSRKSSYNNMQQVAAIGGDSNETSFDIQL